MLLAELGSSNEAEKDKSGGRAEQDGGGDVDSMNDNGYFARFGAPAPQGRGEHAGADLGTRRVVSD